jgi:hypothetical protein
MDFIEDCPSARDTMEIAIDGLARAELLNGRLRVTFYREIQEPDGTITHDAAVSLVCSAVSFRQIRQAGGIVSEMIEGDSLIFNDAMPARSMRHQ